MKKIIFYPFAILVLFSALITSCSDHEDRTPTIIDNKTEVGGTLAFDDSFFAAGAGANFNFTLASSFSKKVRVTVSATSKENRVTYAQVEINPGETQGSGIIEMPNSTIDGNIVGAFEDISAGFVTAKIEGILLLDEVANTDGGTDLVPSDEDNVKIVSNEVSLDFITRLPSADEDSFGFLLDWTNPTMNDLDFQVIDAAFTALFASGSSLDRFESDTFDNSNPDGDYVLYLRIYETPNPTTEAIPYRMYMVMPDGERLVLDSELPSGSPAGGARIPVGVLTKSNGNKYQFTAS